MAIANGRPPPTSPYDLQQGPSQQAPPQLYSTQSSSSTQRPRKSRTFSFRSDKSQGSSGNHHKSQGSGSHKIDLHETSAEKEAKRLHSKADPTLAMQEAEPAEVAATGESILASLRNIQHKDTYGNPIADPDRSNPTRNRWERPLDTIRSFEAAIDGGYSNRRSIIRAETEGSTWGASRRASHYGGNGNGGRFTHDSYYGSRPTSMMYANRADGSQPDLRLGQRDTYYDQQQQQQPGYGNGNGNGYGYPPAQNGRRGGGYPRMFSEPQYGSSSSGGGGSARQQQQQGSSYNDYPTPIPSNHRSYETVTSASGGSPSSSAAEPAGYQTDPTSSDNSSIERVQSQAQAQAQAQSVPRRQPEPVPVNDYGIGFGQSPSAAYQSPSFAVGASSPLGMHGGGTENYQLSGGPGGGGAPPVPPHKDSVLRKPIASAMVRPAAPEKRKSWFARRFSKNA